PSASPKRLTRTTRLRNCSIMAFSLQPHDPAQGQEPFRSYFVDGSTTTPDGENENVARSSEARLDPAQISQLMRDGAPEFAQCRPLLAQTWRKTQSMSLSGVKRTCRF